MKKFCVLLLSALVASCEVQNHDASADRAGADWPAYHGNPHNTHYSTLDQINTGNVDKLKVAWRFDSGDAVEGGDMQGNPMIVRGRLFFVSPKGRIFCLDGATGKQLWVYNPAGEEKVTHWHEVDTGYSGRQPIDETLFGV